MVILSVLIGLAAMVLLLATASDLASLVWIAFRPAPGPDCTRAPPDTPRLLFLVPAHNEELLIEVCIRSLRGLKYPASRFCVVVVADNCSDRTAVLARAAGAWCLERNEPDRPGKPRAIAWALERLPLRDFDALVIVDADTAVDGWFAMGLAAAAPLADKAVQGYNGVSNPTDNAITRMAAVFADAKCRFAYRLKQRSGLNIPLRLGGCIGTSVLRRHGWDAFSIGEDWELYALLTARGVRIEGTDAARVYAQEARSLPQSAPQRQRWTAGKITVLGRLARPLLESRHIGVRQKLDALAELSAPGPVVHLAIATLLGGATVLLRPPGETPLLALLALGLARQVGYTLAALCVQPQPFQAALAFAFLPVYGLWRIIIEVAALRMLGDKPWVRTERHQPTERPWSSPTTLPR